MEDSSDDTRKLVRKDSGQTGKPSGLSGAVNPFIQAGILAGKKQGISARAVAETVAVHDNSPGGPSYPWLLAHYGLLMWLDFYERKQWRTYNNYWYTRHGSEIDHHPDRLEEDHVKWFVNPETRKIRLMFYFRHPTGFVYRCAPTRFFYQLEAAYFRRFGLASDTPRESSVSLSSESIIERENEFQRHGKGLAPLYDPTLIRPGRVLRYSLPRPSRDSDSGSAPDSSRKEKPLDRPSHKPQRRSIPADISDVSSVSFTRESESPLSSTSIRKPRSTVFIEEQPDEGVSDLGSTLSELALTDASAAPTYKPQGGAPRQFGGGSSRHVRSRPRATAVRLRRSRPLH